MIMLDVTTLLAVRYSGHDKCESTAAVISPYVVNTLSLGLAVKNMCFLDALARPVLQREFLYFVYDNDQIIMFCTCSVLYSAHKTDALDIKLCYLTWLDYQLQAWLVQCEHRAMEKAAREYARRQEYNMLSGYGSGSDSETDF